MNLLKGYFSLLTILFFLKPFDTCRLLKYEYNDGTATNYYLVQPYFRECNQEPIYKMLNKPFYIYKSALNDYWCDSYIPSNQVDCNTPCDEIRFLLTNKNTTIPEEFNYRFKMWLPKHKDLISCADQFNKNNELESTTSSNSSESSIVIQSNKKALKEQVVQKNIKQTRTCPRIEFQLFDRNILKYRVQFTIVLNKHCNGYPIYKSQSNIYLYRNSFGHWCQDQLDTEFISYELCNQACQHKTLEPSGILSPFESNSIEVFNGQWSKAKITNRNYRYICTSFINCDKTPCMNNGTCVKSKSPLSGKQEYKCECLNDKIYTGILCDTIIDYCSLDLNPCLNNGICISKINEPLKCTCPLGYIGNACETYDHCLIKNPCLNNAHCYSNGTNITKCECPLDYEGDLCEYKVFNECLNEPEGTIFANPNDDYSFILCVHNGGHSIHKCPQGLVFNDYLKRCDYTSNKPENKTCEPNPCMNNGICTNTNDTIKCLCAKGFTGINCEINIDDCLLASNLCGPNGKCFDLVDGHVCICNDGTYGQDCFTTHTLIPCLPGLNKNISYHSYPYDPQVMIICNENGQLLLNKCPQSLYWNPYKETCTYERLSLDEQQEKNTKEGCGLINCKNNGKCYLDKQNLPFCVCDVGFSGEFCELNINDCEANPCMNNGTCVDGINSYYCICENKYIDRDCCCLNSPNLCDNVLKDVKNTTDGIVRHEHPFTNEQYIVCNLEGYAQVLNCPQGLIWSQEYQTCILKDDQITNLFTYLCLTNEPTRRFMYPYSKLKYIKCITNKDYIIETCSKETPYFCEKTKQCQTSYDTKICNA